MMDIILEIMVEVLNILAIATKEVKRGRFSELMLRILLAISLLRSISEKYLKKLTGNRDLEDSLERLDKLTQEEARMASVELLKMTNSVDGKVMGVDDKVKGVEGKVQDVLDDVQDVRGDVQDIRGDVQDVSDKVRDIDDRVQGIDNNVRGVDDKLVHVNRSLSI